MLPPIVATFTSELGQTCDPVPGIETLMRRVPCIPLPMENWDETWTRMVQPAACVAGQVTVVALKAETSEVPTARFVFAVFMND